MALPRQPGVVVLLLMLQRGGWCSPAPLTPCPEACSCPQPSLINCSSSGLSLAPPHPSMDRSVDLDLSHNLLRSLAPRTPNKELRALWLGNNQVSSLSLCLETTSSAGGGPRPWPPGARRSRRCVSWAPSLLLLSMERNGLVEVPRGLGESRDLQVLQLSYNQISILEPGDLEGLQQLTELHLHHNLLRSLHPLALMGLTSLTVIDLSFNLLTSLSPATSWSLPVGVRFRGGANPWRCDCDMGSLKRRMALDGDGDQTWSDMVCDSPSSLEGRDLLLLHEEDLGCLSTLNQPGFHQDLTVDHGSTALLPCSMQEGSTWWTPKGQESVVESQPGLLLSDITEGDAGLYICVAKSHQDVVVYHLKIRDPGIGRLRTNSRRTRNLPLNTHGIGGADLKLSQVRAMTQDARLGLAVGLSVFFTFLVAFVLGVLARPCIDVLWQKVCGKKKAPSQPRSFSSTSQTPYDNQAYSEEEEDPETVSHRERRVTFSAQDHQDQSSVLYINNLASEHSPNLPDSSQIGKARGRDIPANSETSLSQEVELIPEELGERRSLSSSDEQDNTTRTQRMSSTASSSLPIVSVQQMSSDSAFISETFAHWSPPLSATMLTDQDQPNDNGEAFDFPESFQSDSARSSNQSGSFNRSKMVNFPSSHDLRQCERSSSDSSSQVSGDELNLYTVNPDTELEGELQNAEMVLDHLDPPHSSSSDESDDEVREYTFNPEEADEDQGTGRISENIAAENNIWDKLDFSNILRTKRRLDITVESIPVVTPKGAGPVYRTHVKPHPVIKASTDLSSSSSEREEEPSHAGHLNNTDVNMKVEKATQPHLCLSSTLNPNRDFENMAHDNRWPELDLDNITGIKRRLDMKVPAETQAVPLRDTGQDYRYRFNQPLGNKESTDFPSSSSESEEETTAINPDDAYVQTKVKTANQPHLYLGTMSQSKDFKINAQEDRWPALDLNGVNRVRRCLDITATTESTGPVVTLRNTDQEYCYNVKRHPEITTDLTSSSSDSEAETKGPLGNLDNTHLKTKVEHASQPSWYLGTASPSRDFDINLRNDGRPELNLSNTTGIKQRLDIKVATASGDITSSIGERGEDHRWPKMDLNDLTGVKRRLDITVATEVRSTAIYLKDTEEDSRYHVKPRPEIRESPDFHCSSSSSSSEEDFTGVNVDHLNTYVKTQVKNVHSYELHKVNDLEINAQEDRWPALDIGKVHRVRRCLDITATESTGPAVNLRSTDQDCMCSQWDLGTISHAKRPVVMEALTDSPDSSNNSEEEPCVRMKTGIEKVSAPIVHLGPNKESEMNVQNENWPSVDLSCVPRVKRRLDFKVTTETKNEVEHVYQPQLHQGKPIKDFEINAREDEWPGLDLGNVPGIRRRLDIKVAMEATGPVVNLKDTDQHYRHHVKPHIKASSEFTSSSSESEEETKDPAVNMESKVENVYHSHVHLGTVKPIKYTEINAKIDSWPELELSRLPHIKRHLDFKASTETHVSQVTLDITDNDNWPPLDLSNVTRVKRRLDIDIGVPPSEMTPSGSRVPLQSYFSSCSDGIKTEVKGEHLKPKGGDSPVGATSQGTWPGLNPPVPRITRHLDIKPISSKLNPGTVDLVPVHIDTGSSTTESEDEKRTHTDQRKSELADTRAPLNDDSFASKRDPTVKDEYAVIPGPEVPPDLESCWAGLHLGMSRSRRHLDISAVNAAPPKVSSRTQITKIWSSGAERGDKSKEGDQRGITVDNFDIDEQKKIWSLVDLGTITAVKRHLDIKVEPWSPDSESGAGNWGPEVDLDNITRIKRRLDFKATLSSNTCDFSTEDCWRTEKRSDVEVLMESPPPVPDCSPPHSSPSSESEDDLKQENKTTHFAEYRTHGPARLFPQSVWGTSDTEVASSSRTGDNVMVDGRERKGLGALRALSLQRGRWDMDHEELDTVWFSEQTSLQGRSFQDAPSLNCSPYGKDLEPNTSITLVQEAKAPASLSRSLQRAEYNRLTGHYGQGEDTKADTKPPPEYFESQNFTMVDLTYPMTDV